MYSLPAVPGILATREMNVQFYDAGGANTVIMADAMVSWQVPRPVSEVIPLGHRGDGGAFRTLVGAPSLGHDHVGAGGAKSRGAHRRAAGVDGQRWRSLLYGGGFKLTFRDTVSGPAAAVASGPGECSVVHLQLNGKDNPDLQPPDTYRASVLKIAGLHWELG